MRTILSIGLGISVWALLVWAAKQQPDTVTFSTPLWISFSKIVGSRAYDLFITLVPWFLVGLTASWRPILCGGMAAALASLIESSEMIGVLPQDYFSTLTATSAGLALVHFVYGTAGAALAVAVGGANNSFKPKPLRGSA